MKVENQKTKTKIHSHLQGILDGGLKSPKNLSEQEFEKVKFVQYIPKNLNGEVENGLNSVYLESHN